MAAGQSLQFRHSPTVLAVIELIQGCRTQNLPNTFISKIQAGCYLDEVLNLHTNQSATKLHSMLIVSLKTISYCHQVTYVW